MTVMGNKLFPGFGDFYLSRKGIKGQLTQQREDPNRPANLFERVAGDFGAQGRFDDKATPRYAITRAAEIAGQGGTRAVAALVALVALSLAVWAASTPKARGRLRRALRVTARAASGVSGEPQPEAGP